MLFDFKRSLLNRLKGFKKLIVADSLSIFQSPVATNGKRLNSRFFLVVVLSTIIFQTPSPLQAQTPNTVDRRELFVRAYKSISFLMFMAHSDKSFYDSLSGNEKLMLGLIFQVTSQVDLTNWLKQNEVPFIQNAGGRTYKYKVEQGKTISLTSALDRITQLQFSDDQELFRLDPSQPVRTARVMDSDIQTDIFINTSSINLREQTIDLASALSIMVHEFGHKLADKEMPDVVNSMAGKFESYVRSITNTTNVNGKKISSIKFASVPFYDQWVENTFMGEFLGVNIPKRWHRLSVFDKQGVYVWVEDEKKITDLTDSLIENFSEKTLVTHFNRRDLAFSYHNMMRASDISVQVDSQGQLKFSINAILNQAVLAFEKQGYVQNEKNDSRLTMFIDYQYGSDFINKNLVFAKDTFKLKSATIRPVEYQLPEYKVQYVGKKQRGSDLELFFTIEGDLKLTVDKYTQNADLWPEISVQIGDAMTKIKAHRFYEDSKEFGFRLANVTKLTDKDVIVKGLQLRLKNQNMAVAHTDLVAKSFLPNEITIFKSVAKSAIKIPTPSRPARVKNTGPRMKSIQIWNGSQWDSVKNRGAVKEGSTLRFVFYSAEKLRALSFEQKYEVSVKRWSVVFGKDTDPYLTKKNHLRRFELDSADLRQTLDRELLYVDVVVDHKLQTEFLDTYALPSEDADLNLQIVEKEKLQTDDLRRITDIDVVNESGQQSSFKLKNEMAFRKSGQRPSFEDDIKMRHFIKMKCERLF
ncbi:MAG: hypothetical protein H7256_10875 [Bdellovibrio sp.]|nr:hypothetical protein [Bdellovibrio sp.]